MATVTGYTAARMKVIEDQSIIDGEVVGNDLILEPRGFATAPATYPKINAGNVRGPKGDQGVPGEVTEAELNAAIAASQTATRVPVGAISMFGGDNAPAGYLMCDGAEASRTTYADLFGVLGTKYGVGNGTTTFNLPDLRSRFPAGKGAAAWSDTLNKKAGSKDAVVVSHTHTGPSHSHTTPNHSHSIPSHQHSIDHGHAAWAGSNDNNHTHNFTTNVDGAHAHGSLDIGAAVPIWGNFGQGTLGMDTSGTGHSGVPSNLANPSNTTTAGGHTHTGSTGNQIGSHGHTITVQALSGGVSGPWNGNTGNEGASNTGYEGTGATSVAGVAGTDLNLPPYIVVNFIVKI